MATILNVISSYKTYIAAAGLVGLAVYQVSEAQYSQATQSILAALAAAGLRNELPKVTTTK